ncbi:MAG: hypothetical protein K1X53_14975 [Candidatus Sumerlaeaceae bacterium]|nr:hypothetical protein [Candidatus Sumerlaeaceae bacterium]
MSNRNILIAWLGAALLHALLFSAMLTTRGKWPDPGRRGSFLVELEPPTEAPQPRYLVASMPMPVEVAPAVAEMPEPPKSEPTPPADQQPVPPKPTTLDDATRRELEQERDQLRAQLNQELLDASTKAEQTAMKAMAGRARDLEIGTGPKGTVRELELSGVPQNIVDEIMVKYDLRIVRKQLENTGSQSFLSSAGSGSDRFYSHKYTSPGTYEVFELSKESVAQMSRLEEAEIRKRNLDLEKTRVTHVIFGIVEVSAGQYDLGIIKFEATPLR